MRARAQESFSSDDTWLTGLIERGQVRNSTGDRYVAGGRAPHPALEPGARHDVPSRPRRVAAPPQRSTGR
eukprot:4797522-Prymnesium_polylepis.1